MLSVRPKLKVVPHEARNLSWWKTRKDQIDMDPPYQRRGRLWSDTDKAYLIDSILNGFDVPKLYIADFTYSDSNLNNQHLQYAIIDGKQRLEAIFEFMSGEITLNNDFLMIEKPNLKLGGLGYRDLRNNHYEIAEIFDNFNLLVMSVITDSKELINELFVRLNRSKPLTGAEIRNAMAGPAPDVIRQMADHEFFSDLASFPMQRRQDLNAAAKILLFEFAGRPQDTKKIHLDRVVETTADFPEQLELAARRAHSTLNNLTNIFLPRDRLLSSAGVIPVYYWFVRGLENEMIPYVRDFLTSFEIERKKYMNTLEDDVMGSDKVKNFVLYNRLNRSTNDRQAHQERIRILVEAFDDFIVNRGRRRSSK